MEKVDGAGEVQAQLRPLHHVPQGQGAEKNGTEVNEYLQYDYTEGNCMTEICN